VNLNVAIWSQELGT